jgi:YVTN family beta-propeller protein
MKKILIYLLGALVLSALFIPQGLIASPPSGPPHANTAQVSNPASIIAKIPVGNGPKGLAVNESGNQVYVALYSDNLVARVNENLNHEVAYGYAGDGPNQVAYNPTNQRLYITNRNSNNVTILDASTLVAPTAAVSVGKLPWGVATDPLTKEVYVANFGSGTLTVVNGDSGSLITTMILPPNAQNPAEQPAHAAFDSNSGRLYLAGWQTGTVYIIDRAKHVFNSPYIGQGAFGVAAAPGGARIALTNRLSGMLSVWDCTGMNILSCSVQWIQLPSAYGVTYNPHTNHIFVVGETSSGEVLYVINSQTYQTVQTLSLGTANQGDGGQGIALNQNTDRV